MLPILAFSINQIEEKTHKLGVFTEENYVLLSRISVLFSAFKSRQLGWYQCGLVCFTQLQRGRERPLIRGNDRSGSRRYWRRCWRASSSHPFLFLEKAEEPSEALGSESHKANLPLKVKAPFAPSPSYNHSTSRVPLSLQSLLGTHPFSLMLPSSMLQQFVGEETINRFWSNDFIIFLWDRLVASI